MKIATTNFKQTNNDDQVEGDGSQTPLAYRYVVAPNTTIHCYKPKELGDDVDRKACRGTQLGAFWCGRLNRLPRSAHCDVVWEVPWTYHNKYFITLFMFAHG